MNLRNHQITVKELMADPGARAVLQRRFPKVMGHPAMSAAQTLTLAQVLEFAKLYVPQSVVQETLKELQKL